MIGLCLLAYVVALGPAAHEEAADSFLRDGVCPGDFPRLTPKSKKGQTYLAGNGSGFFITEDGYLLTNYHVIKDAEEVVIIKQDEAYLANVVSRNEKNDLALLKVNIFPRMTNGATVVNGLPKVPFLPLERRISVGQTVYVAGFPKTDILGYEPKVTRGMINSLTGCKGDKDRFQMDALITHGNSGGPVVNEYGALVGVVSSGINKAIGNYNYAINCDTLKSFLPRNIATEMTSSVRKMDSVRLSRRIIDATVMVLVYYSGLCGRIDATETEENDVVRREEDTQLRKLLLDARICKLRKEWDELKTITDWIIRNYGHVDDAKELNDLARDELGLNLCIIAEADGRDVSAKISPLCGFRDDCICCGKPAALYGGDSKRGFRVEARLDYEDAEWIWAGELKCQYDWTGTKEVRVILKHMGKK